MNSDVDKEKSELATFKLFTTYSQLKIIENTIENREPPEPDICCEVEGVGKVAFELTEIIYENVPKKISLSQKTKKLLHDYSLKSLRTKDAQDFKLKYSDALIKVEFPDKISLNKREKLLPKIFSHLLSLQPNFEGKTLNRAAHSLKNLSFVEIIRSYKNQPRFRVSQFTFYRNPLDEALIKKFHKNYITNYPESYWHNIVEILNDKFIQSPFQKLWIFDSINKKILFEASNPK